MKLSPLQLFRICYPQVATYIYVREMQRLLSDCRSCLDIGCGDVSPVQLLDFDHTLGLEAHTPTLERGRAKRTHSQFQRGRAEEVGTLFSENQFDAVVALDLVEHLSKEDGLQLIRAMDRIARKRILLFTPNGYLEQEGRGDDLQEHLSGWDPVEMRRLGFRVIGMHGHRALRGPGHKQRIRPHVLGGVLSVASHYLLTHHHPEMAAALLCVRDVHEH
jgi:SAM-dependent methyltransferase